MKGLYIALCIAILGYVGFPPLMAQQAQDIVLSKDVEETPPRIFEFDALEVFAIKITQEAYESRRAKDPGGMRHWTNVLKKHLYTADDFERFWDHLEHVEYDKWSVDSTHIQFLADSIFVRKYCDFVRMGKGEAFYDRVVVFKKEGEIIGLGKLSQHNNIGSFAPTAIFTDCFGQYSEFERMAPIFYPAMQD